MDIEREYRTEARSLIDSPTVVRRLPAKNFSADRKTYEYLLDNLPISSKLSELYGFGSYKVRYLEGGLYHGEDYTGVEGDFRPICSGPGKRVYMGEGSYDAWYIPKITAEALLVVEYSGTGTGDSRRMRTRVDIYVRTNKIVGYLMELMGEVTDKKLSQLVSSAQRTSQLVARDPRGIWKRMKSSGKFTRGELESYRSTLLTDGTDSTAFSPETPKTRR